MSTSPFEKDLDPAPLVEALKEKTKAGKVKWEPTAAENTFIASVGGGATLRIYLTTTQDYNEAGEFTTITVPELRLVDENGKLLWEISLYETKGELWSLFKLAQRIANKLDERVASLMATLEKL